MSKNTDTEQKKYKPIAPQVPQLCNVTEVGVARNGENPQLKYPLLFKGEHKLGGEIHHIRYSSACPEMV